MINTIILMGRLTQNPEMRTTPNGVEVCTFSIAVERNYQRQGEEKQTDFINCIAWRKTAQFISKYFSKGQMIAVVGSLEVRHYTDNAGHGRTAHEVIVDKVSFCGGKVEKSIEDEEFDEVIMGDEDLPF